MSHIADVSQWPPVDGLSVADMKKCLISYLGPSDRAQAKRIEGLKAMQALEMYEAALGKHAVSGGDAGADGAAAADAVRMQGVSVPGGDSEADDDEGTAQQDRLSPDVSSPVSAGASAGLLRTTPLPSHLLTGPATGSAKVHSTYSRPAQSAMKGFKFAGIPGTQVSVLSDIQLYLMTCLLWCAITEPEACTPELLQVCYASLEMSLVGAAKPFARKWKPPQHRRYWPKGLWNDMHSCAYQSDASAIFQKQKDVFLVAYKDDGNFSIHQCMVDWFSRVDEAVVAVQDLEESWDPPDSQLKQFIIEGLPDYFEYFAGEFAGCKTAAEVRKQALARSTTMKRNAQAMKALARRANPTSLDRERQNEGSWVCKDPDCGYKNFSFRSVCNRCKKDKNGKLVKRDDPKSNWKCAKCGTLNFTYRSSCRQKGCSGKKPNGPAAKGLRCTVPGCSSPHKHDTEGHDRAMANRARSLQQNEAIRALQARSLPQQAQGQSPVSGSATAPALPVQQQAPAQQFVQPVGPAYGRAVRGPANAQGGAAGATVAAALSLLVQQGFKVVPADGAAVPVCFGGVADANGSWSLTTEAMALAVNVPAVWTMDTGADEFCVPANYVSDHRHEFFPWVGQGPFASAVEFGALDTRQVQEVVGQRWYLPVRGSSEQVELVVGPMLSYHGSGHCLASAERILQLTGGVLVQRAGEMALVLPCGSVIDMARKGNLYFLPVEARKGKKARKVPVAARWAAGARRTVQQRMRRVRNCWALPGDVQQQLVHSEHDAYAAVLSQSRRARAAKCHALLSSALALSVVEQTSAPAAMSVSYDELFQQVFHNISEPRRQECIDYYRQDRHAAVAAANAAAAKHKPSVAYRELEARCGFRDKWVVQKVADKLGISLSNRDRSYAGEKHAGHAGRKRQALKRKVKPKGPNEMIALDSLPGLPPSVDGGYTSAVLVHNPGNNASRPYFSVRCRTKEWIYAATHYCRKTGLWQGDVKHGPQLIQSDSDPIAKSDEWNWFVTVEAKAVKRLSAPHHHQQNWWIESKVRVLWGMMLAMLLAAPLRGVGIKREKFWSEAFRYACFVAFILPCRSNPDEVSAYELIPGEEPDYNLLLKPWGARCSVVVDKDVRSGKFAPHVREGFFMGVEDDCAEGTYRVYCNDTGRVLVSDQIYFDKSVDIIPQPTVLDHDDLPPVLGMYEDEVSGVPPPPPVGFDGVHDADDEADVLATVKIEHSAPELAASVGVQEPFDSVGVADSVGVSTQQQSPPVQLQYDSTVPVLQPPQLPSPFVPPEPDPVCSAYTEGSKVEVLWDMENVYDKSGAVRKAPPQWFEATITNVSASGERELTYTDGSPGNISETALQRQHNVSIRPLQASAVGNVVSADPKLLTADSDNFSNISGSIKREMDQTAGSITTPGVAQNAAPMQSGDVTASAKVSAFASAFLSATAEGAAVGATFEPETELVADVLQEARQGTKQWFAEFVASAATGNRCAAVSSKDNSEDRAAALILAAQALGGTQQLHAADVAQVFDSLGHTNFDQLFDSESGWMRQPLTQYDVSSCVDRVAAARKAAGADDPSLAANPWGNEPQSIEQAMKSPWWPQWRAACDREMANHKELGTWSLVPITQVPSDCQVLDMKMFGKVKRGPDGKVLPDESKAFKERCVVRGDQVNDANRVDSGAEVPMSSTCHMIMCEACEHDLDFVNYDVRAAFLGSDLDNDFTYVRMPEYYRTYRYADGTIRAEKTFEGEAGVELVGHLHKSCYGIPQAMKLYIAKFRGITERAGLKRSEHDHCLYTAFTPRFEYACSADSDCSVYYSPEPEIDGVKGKAVSPYRCIVVHWVDDVLLASTPGSPDAARFVAAMKAEFELTGGDPVTWVLNQEVIRDRSNGTMLLSQRAHIRQTAEAVLGSADFAGAKVKSPLPEGYFPRPLEEATGLGVGEQKRMTSKYRQALGMCLWIACQTRADCQYAVGVLGRRASKPSDADWSALRHLVKYMAATQDLCLSWKSGLSPAEGELIMYVDSDFAGDPVTRRSTSGHIAMRYGGAITWCSKRQPLVAMSSMEAELIALCSAALVTVHLRGIAVEMQPSSLETTTACEPTVVLEDNQSAICVAESDMISKRAQHIPRRYFKVRELLSGPNPDIRLRWVKSALNLADAFTKNLTPDILSRLRCRFLVDRAGVG